MIYGFYFRFYKYTKIEWLSVLLSKIAYSLYLLKYWILKKKINNTKVNMNVKEAERIINSFYRDPKKRPTYNNSEINEDIDLSIVVPVYNYKDKIKENIESILNQITKYKYEVIIIDDGSTDGSGHVVEQYQNRNNVKIIKQENGGIAAARNAGIDSSVGRYLMFVDCDDIVHNDIVETLISKAYENNYDIVMCAHNLVKEKDGKVYNIIPNIYPQTNLLKYSKESEILNYAGLPWAKVYKREMWNNVRFFTGYWYEDSIIHFLIFPQCEKFAYVPKVMYEYNWNESNFSHIQENKAKYKCLDRLYLLDAMLEQYNKLGLPKNDLYNQLLIKHISMYFYKTIENLDSEVLNAVFSIICYKFKDELVTKKTNKVECDVVDSIKNNNINIWRLSSGYQ